MKRQRQGLTYAQAAALYDCSVGTLADAVKRGRIAVHSDKSLCESSLRSWHACRTTKQCGPRKETAQVRTTQANCAPRFLEPSDARPGSHFYEVPHAIADLAHALDYGAITMTEILLRHLPRPMVEALAQEWLTASRESMVGSFTSEVTHTPELEFWPDPVIGGTWWQHPIFTRPVDMGEHDWAEAEQRAAAWRAEHGLAAP